MATIFMATDFRAAQQLRVGSDATGRLLAALPGKNLIIGPLEFSIRQISQPGWLVATVNPSTYEVDTALIGDALQAGYKVYLPDQLANRSWIARSGASVIKTGLRYPDGEILEIKAVPSKAL
jgi:hypothetical protein